MVVVVVVVIVVVVEVVVSSDDDNDVCSVQFNSRTPGFSRSSVEYKSMQRDQQLQTLGSCDVSVDCDVIVQCTCTCVMYRC